MRRNGRKGGRESGAESSGGREKKFMANGTCGLREAVYAMGRAEARAMRPVTSIRAREVIWGIREWAETYCKRYVNQEKLRRKCVQAQTSPFIMGILNEVTLRGKGVATVV